MALSTKATSSAPPVSSTPVNSTRRRASIPKQQGNITLKARVANVCFKCFKYFRGVLQLFYIGVCKNRSRCCTCCNGYTCIFQVYVPTVSSVSNVCCKRDIAYVSHMLQGYVPNVLAVSFLCCSKYFHVASVLSRCCICVHKYVASVCSKCFICFRRMLHSKVC